MRNFISKKNNSENKIKFLVIILASLLILLISIWPEFYLFSTPDDASIFERILNTPIHLHDDVMISLRSGYILNKIGIPSFNVDDISQPSTSYFAPYLYLFLNRLFPNNLSTILYSFLGFICTILSFSIIIFNSKSTLNGILTILGFVISSTSINFTLLGWDHLFQTFFLLIGIKLFFDERATKFKLILIGISLSFAVLWRIDSIIIASSILLLIVINECRSRKGFNFLYSLIPFISITFPFLISNFLSFGYFTPTTARLKIGASPSIKYSVEYLLKNTLLDFSVVTIFFILVSVYFCFLNKKKNYQTNFIVFSACLTSLIATINSDVFIGGRMYWGPSLILGFIVCKMSKSLINNEGKFIAFNWNFFKGIYKKNYAKKLILNFLILSIFFSTINAIKNRYLIGAISIAEVDSSHTASQFAITQWIKDNLNPEDGPIGFFFLGVSYHLENYSIADFLGKADENIAQSPAKSGLPGHNKWNIDDSLEKWNPQAIVPPNALRFTNKDSTIKAKQRLISKTDAESFSDSLYGNRKILDNYSFCFVKQNKKGLIDSWGLLIRNDIQEKNVENTSCKRFN